MDVENNGVFEQFDYYRDTTIKLLDSIKSESKADIIPVGFNALPKEVSLFKRVKGVAQR